MTDFKIPIDEEIIMAGPYTYEFPNPMALRVVIKKDDKDVAVIAVPEEYEEKLELFARIICIQMNKQQAQ